MNTFDGWNDELYHHGIRGQKWGIRKYQNPDGTLTEEGKARYGEGGTASGRQRARFLNKLDRKMALNRVKMDQAHKESKREKLRIYNSNTKELVKSVLEGAAKDNISIHSKQRVHAINTGKDYVKGILGSAAAGIALGSIDAVNMSMFGGKPMPNYIPGIAGAAIALANTHYEKGTKYKSYKNK